MSRLNLNFRVVGIPQTAGSKQGFFNKKLKRVMIVDANKRSKPWKALVSAAALEVAPRGDLYRGPLTVSMVFYLPRPKGHYGRRGLLPSAPQYPTGKPDVLKLARAVEDACTGILWHDDAQIVHEGLSKTYGDPPGIEVAVKDAS